MEENKESSVQDINDKIDILLAKINHLEAKVEVTESAARRMEGYIWMLDYLGKMIKGMNPMNFLKQDKTLSIEK